MLPTMGLYKTIDCPYYEKSCDRPYCHFRHRKKTADSENTSSTPEVPTYNPTPKSQLANVKTHIPISYVPDLAQPSDNSSFRLHRFNENLPTYKPTPLSVLSTTGKTSNAVEYDAKGDEAVDGNINFEDLENEFDMIDELISDTTEKIDEPPKELTTETSKTKDTKSKEKSKSRDKRKSSSDEKTKRSSKTDKKSDSKRKSSTKDDKRRSSGSNKKESKSNSKDKHHSSHKDKRNHDRKSRESSGSRKKKKEKEKSPKIEENGDLGNGKLELLDFDDSDLDEDPIEECYKIFTEYKPTEPEIFPEVIKSTEEQPVTVLKKRIAHENVDKNKPKTFHSLKPAIPNAAQIMVNRFKAMRQMQTNEEQQKGECISEIKKHVLKRRSETPPQKVVPAKVAKVEKIVKHEPSVSLIDDIISGKPSNKPKRIAPVQNVNSIQRAKAKIEEMAKMKAINAVAKTAAQTTKVEKRVAHIPEVSVNNVPDLLGSERSKLPVNVRSRYLSMIFDECAKLYLRVEEAQQRAANEEYKCYERCAALVTYRNSAMLAINRLRKELQEREMSGLGPIFPGDTASVAKDSGSEIKGAKLYNNIKQLILTDEELVQHGFPREGRKPGLGKVPSQKQTSKVGLDEYDRVCCRCSKLYRVDEEGFALYEEECLYHPLKKRTFRGESFYLCCKSGEGSGCVTAATHVSESEKGDSDGEIEGYQMTLRADRDGDPRSSEVFALDCEMCYTTKGLELTRVTIVNSECKTVYESLVKPLNPIIDYNTRFSGITKEQMNKTATSILQVQANILHLCNANTILIGHSLESDMKALKIIHSKIIDTSVLFPHKFGLPHKRALRDLAREFLKKIIQNDVHGHDSAEDALTCMELVQWKVKESFKSRGIKA